jgi:hypothetical protein
VGLVQAFDVLVAIPCQPDGDVVLAIERKGVVDDCASASADRKAVDVLLLRHVRGNPDRVASGRTARTSNGHTADLLSGRHVAIEQGRREVGDRHVVEAVARLVCRQQRRGVDVERQEVAHRVLVLGPRQPPDRGCPAGIGMRRGRAVERRLQGRHHGVVGAVVWPFLAHRRHLTGAKLPDDFLPHVRMPGHILRKDLLENEATFFVVLVVAGEAVFVDERYVRRRYNGGAARRTFRFMRGHDAPGRDQTGQADSQYLAGRAHTHGGHGGHGGNDTRQPSSSRAADRRLGPAVRCP